MHNEVLRVLVEGVRREFDDMWSLHDALVQGKRGGLGDVVGWQSRQHLVYEHAKRVPVDRLSIPLVVDDLE